MEVVRIVLSYRNTGEVPNCVNRASAGRSAALLTVRHMNKPGVLAKVFDILGQAALNVEEMENLIYEGGESACARIQLGKAPSIGEVKAIEEEATVLGVSVASPCAIAARGLLVTSLCVSAQTVLCAYTQHILLHSLYRVRY